MRIFLLFIASILLTACYHQPPTYGPPPGFPPPQQSPIGGQMCGGIMGAQCSNPNDYCHMEPNARCGAADMSGVCRPRPQICTKEYAPVCGCGDQTFPNACVAAANGVSIAYYGPCRQ